MPPKAAKYGGKQSAPITILDLGPACLGNVLKHLDPDFKAKNLALVCKSFAKLLAEPDKEAGGDVLPPPPTCSNNRGFRPRAIDVQ
jgi:hypothetical protein